jgi:AcrR family transcriptional regulator
MARPQSGLDRRIVEKARARFLLEGVDGASLRQIAKDAETNIGMVYYYFPTKDDLFLAVIEEVYEGFLAAMNTALTADVLPDERVKRLYVRVATMSEQEFDVIRLIIREGLVSSTRLSKIAERFRVGHLPAVFGLVMEGMGNQTFRQDTPPIAIMAGMMAVGIFPQLMRRIVLGANLPIAAMLPDAETAAIVMHDVIMHGIAGAGSGAQAPEEAASPARSVKPRPSGPRKSTNNTAGTSE